jgi:transposase
MAMRSLSMDLRRRVVAAYRNKEGSYVVLAARFSVSRAVVGKLVRQERELGTLEPQVHLRGRKPAISGEKEIELLRHLKDHPDATLRERIAALGLDCTVKTMWQTIRRLKWRYKKSHRAPRSKIAKTSP